MYRSMSRRFLAAAAFVAISTPTAAFADQSQCSDVLMEGTRSRQLYRDKVLYRQLADLHFAYVGYEQSKKDTSLSGNVPIGKIVIGGEYNENQYNAKRERILQNQVWDTQYTRSIDVLLSTGDNAILQAWSRCMRDRNGGLSIRFDKVTGKTAVAVIEWFGSVGINKTSLTRDWSPPAGVTVRTGRECLLRDFNGQRQEFTANKPGGCAVEFQFDSARTPLTMVLNSENGSASAYLPPRIFVREDERPYAFTTKPGCEGPAKLYAHTMGRSGKSVSAVYCSDDANGWSFKKEDSRASINLTNHKDSNLQKAWVDFHWVGLSKAIVQLNCSNSAKHHDFVCETAPALMEIKAVTEEMP